MQRIFISVLGVFVLMTPVVNVYAQTTRTLNDQLPTTDISDKGFKLVVCDGPDGAGHYNPVTKEFSSEKLNGSYKYPLKDDYIPCDFNGLMMQVQHLINIAIVVGVLVAILGFSYAGFLYITGSGDPGKLTQAHSVFKKVLIGFIIMLSAWLIVFQVLSWLTGKSGFGALLGK